MTAVRPDLPPVSTQTAAPTPAPVKAAQAAFFRAALEASATPQPQAQSRADASAPSEPMRAQRPGALLDIRV